MQIKKTRRKPVRSARALSKPAAAKQVAVVRSLAEARAVLAAASVAKVVLVSPPGAAAYLGVGFFAALVDAARAEFPGIAIEAVMDCGEDPGWALSALRMGFKAIALRGDPRARARVAAIARAMGARVLVGPPRSGAGRRGGGEKE
jgi:hypothetical protein